MIGLSGSEENKKGNDESNTEGEVERSDKTDEDEKTKRKQV